MQGRSLSARAGKRYEFASGEAKGPRGILGRERLEIGAASWTQIEVR